MVARGVPIAIMLAACADPAGDTGDDGEVTVTVISPNGGETVYAAEAIDVQWTGAGASGVALTYDVVLVDASGGTTDLQRGVADASSITWTPIGVPAPTPYRIRVTATSARGNAATDESDAEFLVSPPAQGTSFAAHLQPIFTSRCAMDFCHNTQWQVALLDLSPGVAYTALVDVPSRETPCTSYVRVAPGQPNRSYLVFKLEGGGPCFAGVRMPKDATALTPAQIALVRDWIAAGAKHN